MSDTGHRKVVSDPSPPGAVLKDRSEREELPDDTPSVPHGSYSAAHGYVTDSAKHKGGLSPCKQKDRDLRKARRNKKVCRNYATTGSCKFGEHCWFLHVSEPSLPITGPVPEIRSYRGKPSETPRHGQVSSSAAHGHVLVLRKGKVFYFRADPTRMVTPYEDISGKKLRVKEMPVCTDGEPVCAVPVSADEKLYTGDHIMYKGSGFVEYNCAMVVEPETSGDGVKLIVMNSQHQDQSLDSTSDRTTHVTHRYRHSLQHLHRIVYSGSLNPEDKTLRRARSPHTVPGKPKFDNNFEFISWVKTGEKHSLSDAIQDQFFGVPVRSVPVNSPDELHTGDHVLYHCGEDWSGDGYRNTLVAREPEGGHLRVITRDSESGLREATLQFSSLHHLHKVQYTPCLYSGEQAVQRALSGELDYCDSHELVSWAKTGVRRHLYTPEELHVKGQCGKPMRAVPVSSPDELHIGDHIIYHSADSWSIDRAYGSALVTCEPEHGRLSIITESVLREETVHFSSLCHLRKVQYTRCLYSGERAVQRARGRWNYHTSSHGLVSWAKTGVSHSLSTIVGEFEAPESSASDDSDGVEKNSARMSELTCKDVGMPAPNAASINQPAEFNHLVHEVAMEIPKKWREVGQACGLEEATLKEIEDTAKQEPHTTDAAAINVMSFKRTFEQLGAVTWLRVVQALESVGEQALADRLRELYSGEEPLEDMPAYNTHTPKTSGFCDAADKVSPEEWLKAGEVMEHISSKLSETFPQVFSAINEINVTLNQDDSSQYISESVILCSANSRRALRRTITKQEDHDGFLQNVFGAAKLLGKVDGITIRVIEERQTYGKPTSSHSETGSEVSELSNTSSFSDSEGCEPPVHKEDQKSEASDDSLDYPAKMLHVNNEVAMEIPHKWREMGTAFGMKEDALKAIELNPVYISRNADVTAAFCFAQVLKQLEAVTWLRVVQALESVGEQALADRLKELYSGEEPLEDMPAYTHRPTKEEFRKAAADVEMSGAVDAMKVLRKTLDENFPKVSDCITEMSVRLGQNDRGQYISEPVILCSANSRRALRRTITKQEDRDGFLENVFDAKKLMGAFQETKVKVIEERRVFEQLSGSAGSELKVVRPGTVTCLIEVTEGEDRGFYLVTCRHLVQDVKENSSVLYGGVQGQYMKGLEQEDIALVKIGSSSALSNNICLPNGDTHTIKRFSSNVRPGLRLIVCGAATGPRKARVTRFGSNGFTLTSVDGLEFERGDSGAPVIVDPEESSAQAGDLVGMLVNKSSSNAAHFFSKSITSVIRADPAHIRLANCSETVYDAKEEDAPRVGSGDHEQAASCAKKDAHTDLQTTKQRSSQNSPSNPSEMVLKNVMSDSGISIASDGNGDSNPCSPVSSVDIPGSELHVVENSGTLTCMIRDSGGVYAVTCQHLFECLKQSAVEFEVKCAGVRGRYVRGVPTLDDQSQDCSKRDKKQRRKEENKRRKKVLKECKTTGKSVNLSEEDQVQVYSKHEINKQRGKEIQKTTRVKRTEADIALVRMDNANQFSNVIRHPDGCEIHFAEYVDINKEKKKLFEGLVCVGAVTSSQKCRITGYTENDHIILGSLSDESNFKHASGDSGAPVIIHTDQLTRTEPPIATQNDDRKNDVISQEAISDDSACVGGSRKPSNAWKLFAMVTAKCHSLKKVFKNGTIARFDWSKECEAQLFSSSISEVCKSPVLESPHIPTDTIPPTNGSNEVAAASSTFTTPPEDTRNQQLFRKEF